MLARADQARPAAKRSCALAFVLAKLLAPPPRPPGTVAINDQLDLLAEFMGVGEKVAAITNSVGAPAWAARRGASVREASCAAPPSPPQGPAQGRAQGAARRPHPAGRRLARPPIPHPAALELLQGLGSSSAAG